MIEVHFLFMQDEWVHLMAELPRENERVTFSCPSEPDTVDYAVSVVHWFISPTDGRSLIPYVSLRQVSSRARSFE